MVRMSRSVSLLFCILLGALPAQADEFVPSHLFVASVGGDRILELDDAGALASALTSPQLEAPRGIAFAPDGKLYATSGDRVLRFNANGQVEATLGEAAKLEKPRGLAIGPQGHLFATSGNRVVEMDADGNLIREIGKFDDIGVPAAICFGANDHLYVATAGSNSIKEFDAGFRKLDDVSPPGLAIPIGMACGPDGLLYVASFFSGSVLVLDDAGGVVRTISDSALLFPAGIAIGPNGNVFVSTFFGNAIVEFEPDGTKLREIALPADTPYPETIAFSPYRFTGKFEGKLILDGEKPREISAKAACSYAPGFRTVMFDFGAGTDATALASALGSEMLVFHGFEVAETPVSKTRLLHAAETVLGSDSQGSIQITITGKAAPFGFATAFQPKSLAATLQYAVPGALFRGTYSAKKLLE